MSEPVYVSIGPVGWVMAEAPGLPPRLLGVLVALAMHADADGRNAYPSQEKLGFLARKTDRQVRRDLDELEAIGLIERGDQDRVRFLPLDKRPIVWDLATWRDRQDTGVRSRGEEYRAARAARRGTDRTRVSGGDRTPEAERPDTQGMNDRTRVSDEVISEQPVNNHVEVISAVSGRQPGASLRCAPPEDDNWHLAGEPDEPDEGVYDWEPSPEDVAFIVDEKGSQLALARRRSRKPVGRTVEELIASSGIKSVHAVYEPPTVDVREPLRGIRYQPHAFRKDERSPGFCATCDFPEGNRTQHPTSGRA